MPSATALMFQGGIGLLGLFAVRLFEIPLHLDGLYAVGVVLFGTVGAGGTYLVLVVLSRVPWLSPGSLCS